MTLRNCRGIAQDFDELFMFYRVTGTGHAVDVSYKLTRGRLCNGRRVCRSEVLYYQTFLGMVGACIGGLSGLLGDLDLVDAWLFPDTKRDCMLWTLFSSEHWHSLMRMTGFRSELAQRLYGGADAFPCHDICDA